MIGRLHIETNVTIGGCMIHILHNLGYFLLLQPGCQMGDFFFAETDNA